MVAVTIKELLESGVHFGHQTKRWNPKMKRYIFEARNHIYIVDLHKTIKQFKKALEFVRNTVADGGSVLFVGTKKQAKDVILEAAEQSGMYYINERWLGGTLTNNRTIKQSIKRLVELEKKEEDGLIDLLKKKEASSLRREKTKLHKYLDGIKDMKKLPGVLFVVDTKKEKNAIAEAKKLKIPVVAIVDTNCDPDDVDICIPGNDDAIRSIRLLVSKIAQATVEGASIGKEREAKKLKEESEKKAKAAAEAKAKADAKAKAAPAPAKKADVKAKAAPAKKAAPKAKETKAKEKK